MAESQRPPRVEITPESQRPPRVEITPESQRPPRVEITPERKKSVLRGERSLADYFGLPDNEQFDRFMKSVISTVLAGYEPAKARKTRKQAEGADLSGDQVRTFLENLVETQAVALGDTEYEAFRAPVAPQELPIGDTSRSRPERRFSDVDDLDESAGSRPLSPLMGGASSGDVGAVATAPAAPKKQTAPATKAARTDDEDAPAQEMRVRPEPRPERRSSDVDDLDESAASMENQMTSLMGAPAAQPGGVADVGTEPTAKTQRMRDEEIAAREPLGESAGRLAIQNFMERNFGFTPTVTFDVEEQEPGGTGSLF